MKKKNKINKAIDSIISMVPAFVGASIITDIMNKIKHKQAYYTLITKRREASNILMIALFFNILVLIDLLLRLMIVECMILSFSIVAIYFILHHYFRYL